ncbi:exosortase-associated protein EpsI, V-type [uncultured Phenylobacterium sp.]|uniref:exosortase-associated protein EpsI, V-type n=1 Tax=uncultured Phenylobacterium sp. TaxID=349273 RepID=UPI0025D2A9E5|nr:exosortase-associated protein EpsI, V-type [uncultured Phenylobacterium sp.]
MSTRRDVILGGAAVASAGLALGLRPRRKLNLLGQRKIETIVPAAFTQWTSQVDANLLQPKIEGSLASKLYSETVSRIYYNEQTGDQVMMLVAYGNDQSDLLQLHRPESCYPAVGYSIVESRATTLPLGGGAALPCRRVIAEKSGYRENIVYWTRLGEFLPVSASEQRQARLEMAMRGYVTDGALFRCSMIGKDADAAFKDLDAFIASLLRSVTADGRPALVGNSLARAIQS